MVMVLLSLMRRWWQAGVAPQDGLSFSGGVAAVTALPGAITPRRVAPRAPAIARRLPARPFSTPVTPFGALARARPVPQTVPVTSPVGRRTARRFWMTLDPQDRRHAALGGSFAEVCAALEQLAALEERRT